MKSHLFSISRQTMKYLLAIVAVGGIAVAVVSQGNAQTNCSTNLLVNGSFEQPSIPDHYWILGSGDPLITGWKTLGAGVEYHNWQSPGTVYPVASEAIAHGLYAIDLASTNGPGGIEQSFTTEIDHTYLASFYLGTSAEQGRVGHAKVRVTAGDRTQEFEMFNDSPRTYFTHHVMPFRATATITTLSLTTAENPQLAFVEIDDVKVTLDCQSPPQDCLLYWCPTNVTVATCETNGTHADYSIWATNLCNPSDLTVTMNPPPGSFFPMGESDVIVTISGSGQTNSCRFKVIVVRGQNCGGQTSGCSTNLLVNGSFEHPGVPDGYVALAAGDNVMTGWVPILNGVEYYNPVVAPLNINTGGAAEGNYLLDLAPVSGLGGGVRQSFATVPGRVYRVSFAFGTSRERGSTGRASLVVSAAGRSHAFNISTENSTITWTRQSFSFTAISINTTLVFCTTDDPAVTFVNLDDVKVSDCCEDSSLKIRPSITVEWECGVLQSATDVAGPYSDVPDAVSPYTEPLTGPRKFWRTR